MAKVAVMQGVVQVKDELTGQGVVMSQPLNMFDPSQAFAPPPQGFNFIYEKINFIIELS